MNWFSGMTLCGLSAVSGLYAESTLEPFLRRGLGSTLYRMEFTAPAPEGSGAPEGTVALAQSELEYPLNANQAGLKWVLGFGSDATRTGNLSLSAWTNLSDPSGFMKDSDWIGSRSSGGNSTLFKFSYTESSTEMRLYGADLGLNFGTWTLLGFPTRYGMGVRGEYFNFEMFGIDGWQRPPGGEKTPVSAFNNQLVLTYWQARAVPRLYADLRLLRVPAATLNLVLSGGVAIAFDEDDHVLRQKQLWNRAFGFEAGALTEFAFRMSDRVDLMVAGEFAYFGSKGTMDQRFYGDDPFTDTEDETGRELKNLTTRVISAHGSVRIGFRYAFTSRPLFEPASGIEP